MYIFIQRDNQCKTMDTFDLFLKLSSGTKFDRNRFRTNAQKFRMKKKNGATREDTDINTEVRNTNSAPILSSNRKRKNDDNTVTESGARSVGNSTTLTVIGDFSVSADGSRLKRKKNELAAVEKKQQLEQEKINHFRNENQISVIGRHIPQPIATFNQISTDYNVSQDVIENIEKCEYTTPTPIQMQAIPIMLKKRPILACAPTGSGKTLAFLLPLIHHLDKPRKVGFRALILSPTRELAEQTYRETVRLSEGRGLRIHIISKIKQALEKYRATKSQKFDILITTPKRLVFLLNQNPPAISLGNVEWLIVDEADKLFEDGARSFRNQLKQITKSCNNENLCHAMFSATNTPILTRWCRHNLRGLVNVTIGQRNAATSLVEQELLFVGSERGKLVGFRNIIAQGILPPILVFVQSKERAQELFNELIYDGLNVDVIHGDRTQSQRDNAVRSFREGRIWVLVCTELMSRGIDFKGVNLVINYDFPPSAISYVHRIGRTGRAGHKGKAITFFTEQDTVNLRSIATVMRAAGCEVPEYMLSMKKYDKRERRKMERKAPERDSISTVLKLGRPHGGRKKRQ